MAWASWEWSHAGKIPRACAVPGYARRRGGEEGERKAWRARIDRGEECVMGGGLRLVATRTSPFSKASDQKFPIFQMRKRVALPPILAFVPRLGCSVRPKNSYAQALLGSIVRVGSRPHPFSAKGEITPPSCRRDGEYEIDNKHEN